MTSYYERDELMQLGFLSVGENVLLSRKASVYGAENMRIGNNVRIDDFCFLSGKITLSNYIVITTGCVLYGGEHGITFSEFSSIGARSVVLGNSDDYSGETMTNPMIPAEYKNITDLPIHIGRHVIIGTGCTLMPGITLADGCSIGAMSLVAANTEPWTINVGIPCKAIKKRSQDLLKYERQFLLALGNDSKL